MEDEFGFFQIRNGSHKNKRKDADQPETIESSSEPAAARKEEDKEILDLDPESLKLEAIDMLKHKHSRNVSNNSSTSINRVKPNNVIEPKESKVEFGSQQDDDTQLKLPQQFVVKYLGFREATNLWGIKHTRKPVDDMVQEAKDNLSSGKEKTLPLLSLKVTQDGIIVGPMPQNTNPNVIRENFAISSISYGVQDLIYTRVFAMIVVLSSGSGKGDLDIQPNPGGDSSKSSPFRCYAFVTSTRETAKTLTYALASAFHSFSQKVAALKADPGPEKPFAIDLRRREELETDLADSEA